MATCLQITAALKRGRNLSQAKIGNDEVNPDLLLATKRSNRYVIRAPLQYRLRGERKWHPGISQNMSQSGILFESTTPLSPGSKIEIQVTLAPAFSTSKGSIIRCQGTIVRSIRDGIWAARIFTPRLRRVDANRASHEPTSGSQLRWMTTPRPAFRHQPDAEPNLFSARHARSPRHNSQARGPHYRQAPARIPVANSERF